MRKMLSYSILDLSKCLNRKTCTFTFMRFRLRLFPRSKFESESVFFHKVMYKYCSKTNFDNFGLYLKKSRNGFPIVFSNLGGRVWGIFSS